MKLSQTLATLCTAFAIAALPRSALSQGASSPGASGQERPPLRILVGFPPGGASDGMARLLADKLREPLKQNVIVENRPGIGGRLAAQAVKAAPAGAPAYMVAPNATFVFQHLTYPPSVLGYDMTTDFTSVAQLSSYPIAMVVNAATGAKSARDLVAWVKANPAKNTFGTAGAGGETHFNGLQFGRIAGVAMEVVPYRGNAPLLVDLVGGQLGIGVMVAGDAAQQVRAGKLGYVGVFAPKRSPLIPEVPTMAEQGFDTGGSNGWFGMWGPAGLPRAELDRMQDALRTILDLPEVREQIRNALLQIAEFQRGAEVDRKLKAELDHWGPIVKSSGFKPQP